MNALPLAFSLLGLSASASIEGVIDQSIEATNALPLAFSVT
jgi:hypothetical protein